MSLLNGFNGQQGGRPAARPAAEPPQGVAPPNWPQPSPAQSSAAQVSAAQVSAAQAAQAAAAHWAQHPGGQQPAQPGYAPQGYGQPYGAAPPAQGYGQPHTQPHAQPHTGQHAASPYGGLSANPDPYAASFEPYVPQAPVSQHAVPQSGGQRAGQQSYQQTQAAQGYQPQSAQAYAPQAAPQGYGQQGYGAPEPRGYAAQNPAPQQWPASPAPARGFDPSNYLQQPAAQPAAYRAADPRQHDSEPALSDWSNAHHGGQHGAQAYDGHDAHGGQNDIGFAQPAGGELDQGYADEDGQEYEVEEPSRFKRPMMIAAALAGAILVGGGMSYGYKAFLGGGTSGSPPTVKSASAPSKTKPADAGGKQFAHTDSKIMGRLGDGSTPAAGAADAASGELDANGSRKVSTLVVGRDGSIQAPAAAPVETPIATAPIATAPPPTSVSVPGMMVVDAMGPKSKTVAASIAAGNTEAPASVAEAPQKLVVTPPAAAQKAVKVAAAETQRALPEATGSIETPAAPAPIKKPVAAKKVAAATPAAANDAFTGTSAAPAAAPVTSGGASGFVAVLASVPKSASSQSDALKRYADMQQKYGGLLAGKTPSVAEANLGAKGAYHRLVVGPPASREQASTLCTQLKAQGYADCWVTSY